ncbi:MAG: methyltransferase domain-containing protein [Clostridia bacterium]|nr:methyltransferase domain-containing protein [Clostridia bacterium]
MIERLINELNGEGAAQALSALCAHAKSGKGREEIAEQLDRSSLMQLIKSDEPKVRKNAYRLIGALKDRAYAPALCESLKNEDRLFCVPSLLLALGSLEQREALESYTVPTDCAEKHQAEIALALSKARQTLDQTTFERIEQLDREYEILCTAPKGFERCLYDELSELGFAPVIKNNSVYVTTARIGQLHRARCLFEALIPIKSGVLAQPKQIAAQATPCIGTQYRIELRGYLKDRRKLISEVAALMPAGNNPSNYDCELRIECRMDECDLYWKLWNVRDERFSYRKRTIAASMQPSLAAALCRYAKGFEHAETPVVIDPFCGSGTLLFERERLSSCRALIGVDKSGKAIEAARANGREASSQARFVCKDALRFDVKDGADLILSNLPFGNRVGTHEDNKRLYEGFIKRLPTLLKQDGIAVLYTMEYRLLEGCIKREKRLKLTDSRRTEAGGLLPWVFVLERNEKK